MMRPDRPLSWVFRLVLVSVSSLLFLGFAPDPRLTSISLEGEVQALPQEWVDQSTLLACHIAGEIRQSGDGMRHLVQRLSDLPVKPSYRIISVQRSTEVNELAWPVSGAITSSYGYRRHPVTRRHSFHAGIDIRARGGTPVSAPCSGRVVEVERAGAMGRMVRLQTPGGTILSFGHLSGYRCRQGDWIRKGEILGLVGSSGRATGPHLHFAVQKNGKYLNPLTFLRRKTEILM